MPNEQQKEFWLDNRNICFQNPRNIKQCLFSNDLWQGWSKHTSDDGNDNEFKNMK